jgi:tripartite-type tricarboxylate transporter receptor subunit TctC
MMKLPRRRFLRLAAGAVALPALTRVARASAYPTRPVRLIVGFAAGGPADTCARLIGHWLSERLGQNFIVENRPGAGSNLATEMVVRAPPDGYTLLEASSTNAWNTTLYRNLSFDFSRDIAPVASLCRYASVLALNPSIPAETVPAFIAYTKANPGRITMASGGVGTPSHLYGELFQRMTGVELIHVPFRGGGPAVIAMLGGQVQVFFGTVSGVVDHIRTGKLRALAVTTATRMSVLPQVAPLGDFLPGYEGSGWECIGAPKDTPVEIIDKLNKEVNAALADDTFKSRLANLGLEPFATSPAELRKFIADYTERWGKVIQAAGIKAD